MNHLQNSNLVAAAFGLAVGVVSAATIFIYHKIMENQNHSSTVNVNLEAVNKKVAELQAEIDALRVQQSQLKKRRKAGLRRHISSDSTYVASDNDTDIDAFSSAGTDVGDDEFYDCSDSESAAEENDVRISEATELDLVLTKSDKYMEEEFNIEIFYKLQTLAKAQPNNVDVIWRFAKYCYKYSRSTPDVNTKKAIIEEGIAACEELLHLRNPNLHKSYAILLGLQTDYLPIAERIKCGFRFRDFVVEALEMIPNDAELYHLLGRFQYEVASLSWLERKVAQTLFAEFPNVSYEDALNNFLKVDEILPNAENILYLSKSYIALKLYEKAVECLQRLVSQPATTSEERDIINEGAKLLKKYS